MNCHRCKNLVYCGCPYGRCGHPGHKDVTLRRSQDGKRKYNRKICPDFELRKSCSNCAHWIRGRYFADGKTPSRKGRCSLDILYSGGAPCGKWEQGPTSWRRPKEDFVARVGYGEEQKQGE